MTKKQLMDEFRKDYSNAISFYNEKDYTHFNRDIRVAIENFGRILIFDILGESIYRQIENNSLYVDKNGVTRPQGPDFKVESSGWIKTAKYALRRTQAFKSSDTPHVNLKRKIDACIDTLIAQYGEISELSQHSGGDSDLERRQHQANLCVATFATLFHSLNEFIHDDVYQFFQSLPRPQSSDGLNSDISNSSAILEKETALYALDDFANGFKRQGGVKFIAILSDNVSKVLGPNFFSGFFRIKWSLVIDFNPDDTGKDTLFAVSPSSSTHIVTDVGDVTDGFDLTNWIFARGRNSLNTLSGKDLIRSFPSLFKNVFSQMTKAGSTDDYVIVSFCDWGDDTNEIVALTKALDKLEDVFDSWDSAEKRCKIACVSQNPSFCERLRKWGDDIGFKPLFVPADIKDFVNHIHWTSPTNSTNTSEGRQLIRGKSLDITDDIKRYKAAGIEFFGPHMTATTSDSIWDFYSGAEISWQELENDCDVKRDLYIKIKNRVLDIIKNIRNVKTFTLKHKPGSGGSTMARRLAFDIYKEDEANTISCIPVLIKNSKNIKNTADYLCKLAEDSDNSCILAVVESKNVGRSDFDHLTGRLARAKKRVVLFYVETHSGRFNDSQFENVALLEDVLHGDEPKFVVKYKSQGLADSTINEAKAERNNKSLEVIDFPLLLKEDVSSDSISSYVAEWMNVIPDNLKMFIGYVGFVSHYSQAGLNQNLVRETWLNSAEGRYSIKGYGEAVMSAIYKLLIEEYSGDEPLGVWRPRYNKFALFLIQSTWGENWKVRLPEISKQFIQYCAQSGQLGNDDKDMLHSLFIIRRDIDFRAEVVGRKNKFSLLINDLEDPERAASIFNILVETYPSDAVFHSHYARFLYEKASSPTNHVLANDKLFHDAQKQLDIAFDLNPYDADVFHMQGMLIRRQISSLRKEFEHTENKTDEYIDEIHSTMSEWVQEALNAFDKSIEYDPSSPYGYAASCQLLREVIDFGRVILGSDDFSFCDREPQYIEYVDELGYRLDQFEQVCYSFKEDALAQIKSSLIIYNDVRLFHRNLIGCAASSISKYRDMYSQSSGEKRGMYGDFLIKSILYSKTHTKDHRSAYRYLREDERNEIEQVLQRKRSEGDLRCFDDLFKLYRYGKKEYPIDSVIDLLKDCESQYLETGQKGWGYLNACYYLAVCYSALAIQGDELSYEWVKNAQKYFDEATKLAHVFDKSTIYALCYLGEETDIHCIVDRESEGMLVTGVIIKIDGNKGIIRLKCGLEASFNAKGKDKFKYQGKSIQGIIGFKYSGLGLYQFGEAVLEDISDAELDDIIERSYAPDFSDEETVEDSPATETPGPKILGTISLPKSDPKNDSIDLGKVYSGTYIKSSDSVRCSVKPYPFKVQSKQSADLYDGADVLFEIGSAPNKKDPGKTYYYAMNVRLK